MAGERRPNLLANLSDDQLGTLAVSLVVSELQWTPDVAPAVLDRITRDAVAYPEHFDRQTGARDPSSSPGPAGPSVGRTITRIAIMVVVVAIVVALVVLAATANASAGLAVLAPILSPVQEAP